MPGFFLTLISPLNILNRYKGGYAMSSYAYYNGRFGKAEDIQIPLSDRATFFGDAIYDAAIGAYDRILWEGEHIDRFFDGARRVGMHLPFGKRWLSSLLREVAVKSMTESYFIYFQASRSNPVRTHSASGAKINLLITVSPIEITPDPPPMRLISVEDLRYGYCDIKTVNLMPAVLAQTRAEKCGCDEAVFIKNGFVTECTKSNISVLNQGRVITHPISSEILPGITRAHLLSVCRGLGLEIEERPFTKDELISAEEIFITSCSKLCKTA